ncbi:hypothetical protein ACFXGA_09670 [Actinosynnema sp. NPDC059335]|uniref:hypothetical protein n=1 Tax=Actinosynnema sp. NPDC059335 TaxID=3346804 RepID=UPI00366BA142
MAAVRDDNQGFNLATCEKNIAEYNMYPSCDHVPGLEHHCDKVQSSRHEFCMTHGQPNWPIESQWCELPDGTTKYFYDSPDPAFDCQNAGGRAHTCMCCCSCMAYGTMIGLPEGREERIEALVRGERVLTGALGVDGKVSWSSSQVTFSDGAGGGGSLAVHLSFDRQDGSVGELICSPDQPIALAGGTLVQASQLHVRDHVLGGDGGSLPVRSVAIGEYSGGLHHIGAGKPTDPTGAHLLQASGVVVGDYYLQLRPELLAGRWAAETEARPHAWEPDYAQTHEVEKHTTSLVFGTANCGTGSEIGTLFTVFSDTNGYLENDVAALLTPAQANDVLLNGKQMSFGNPIPKYLVETVFKHMQGFLPDVDLHLDWNRPEPNVYAFRRFGRQTVVVTGGLARAGVLDFEGLVMAVAHGANRLSGVEPLNDQGFTVTGRADYDAFHDTSRIFWWITEWSRSTGAAQKQFNDLFDLISEQNAQGNPDAGHDEPSIACRRKCIAYSSVLGFPECAGGPPLPRIAIEDAAATTDTLTLVVNLSPKPESVTATGNYDITPAVTVTEAALAPDSSFHILVKADFQPDQEYRVTVRGLVSILGSGMDPERDSIGFTAKVPAGVRG